MGRHQAQASRAAGHPESAPRVHGGGRARERRMMDTGLGTRRSKDTWRRWMWVVAELPMAVGYDGLGLVLFRQAGLAASAWLFGFDFARARELRFIEDIVRREPARLVLFAIAALAGVLVIGGGEHAAVVGAGGK